MRTKPNTPLLGTSLSAPPEKVNVGTLIIAKEIEMRLDEYIQEFRKECASLPWEEVRDLDVVFGRKCPREVFEVMEDLRKKKKVLGARFEKMLTDFFWLFGQRQLLFPLTTTIITHWADCGFG